MIKAVLFDMDGLMLDTERIGVEVWKEIESEWPVPGLSSFIYKCFGVNHKNKQKLFEEQYGKDFPYATFCDTEAQKRTAYMQIHGIPKKEGLMPLLDFIRAEKLKAVVATSTASEEAHSLLRATGILPYFDAVITGDMIENGKPEPDIYLKACETVQVKPEHCIGLEDSINGILSLDRADIRSILIPDIVDPPEEIKRLCFRQLSNLKEVIQVIKEDNV